MNKSKGFTARECSADQLQAPALGVTPQDDPGEFGAGHDIGPGGRYWRGRAEMWRAWFCDLVDRLAPLVPPVEYPEGYVGGSAFTDAQQIASKLEALVEAHRNLLQEFSDTSDERDQARRTAEFWKANHLAGNAEIERLHGVVCASFDFVHSTPHDDNCFVTDEPPGNRCVCGKDSLAEALHEAHLIRGTEP